MRLRLLCAGIFVLLANETLNAQGTIKLTVYNNDLALVSETREVAIAAGNSRVEFPGVAARIIPASVLINVLDDSRSLQVSEQNFEFDLIGSAKLFDKYLEQKITLETEHNGRISGKLLSRSGTDIILQMSAGQLMVMNTREILSTRFDKLPEGLRTRPTLLWEVENDGKTARKLEVSYLTNGISWQAEYVGELGTEEKKLNFTGWISVDNRSGKTYKNAKLKLVAGDINRQHVVRRQSRYPQALLEKSAAVDEKSFFEYHLYTVKRATSVKDQQEKQIIFIAPIIVQVKKEYVYTGSENPRNVSVYLKFRNDRSAGLGMALPAGIARIYKADSDDGKIFLGEDRLSHTPKNEDIRLKIGNAFDIIGERKELYTNKLSKRSSERAFEISLRNHKQEAVVVLVIEQFYGDWRITESSLPVKSKTAEKATWLVKIPAEGESKLNFVIHSRW